MIFHTGGDFIEEKYSFGREQLENSLQGMWELELVIWVDYEV